MREESDYLSASVIIVIVAIIAAFLLWLAR